MTEPRKPPTIVTRPEPPPDDDAPKPKISPEEIRALLAVTETNRPPWGRVARRAGLGLIPTAILGVLLDAVIGWYATPLMLVVWIAWAAWPLLRQNRDGWT